MARDARENAPSGLIVVDKPGGMTSHDVVARIRRLAGTRRVGHAGTLDPMATGVLVVGVEKATRLLGHLTLTDKEYQATIRLGQATDTGDAWYLDAAEGRIAAHRGQGPGECVVSGPASGVYLFLWNRSGPAPADVAITGRQDFRSSWQASVRVRWG